ncbi:MAG TPA: recombinase family protein [Candidatus Babeliaceae bacterium]|nr:recombinase family protein [Candidatus Babeliaceae bacterium]
MEKQVPLRYCLYARKSSEQDERQAMSIDSQLAEMRAMADNLSINVVAELQEAHSAKASGQRPVYNKLLQGLRNDEYNAILTWAPDRLSRNAGDLGAIVDLMDQGKLLHIRTDSQTFTNNPNEKFLLMILCSQAKLENDNKAINVRRGMRTKLEMGWRPGVAPLGYINRSFGGVNDVIPDPERADIVREIFHKAGYEGWSGRKIKQWVDAQGMTTRSGKEVPLSSILAILLNPFYYGEFEFVINGEAKWYKGAHTPLISKELFDLVQQTRGGYKGVWGTKSFAFRGLLKCGECGAEITAQDKIKFVQKINDYKRFVYYNCTTKDKEKCQAKYMNEETLCELMQEFIEKNHKDIKITDKLRAKVEKHTHIAKTLLVHYDVDRELGEPLVEYSRYVLTRGTDAEKSNLASHMKSKLQIRDGQLEFAR